MIISINSSNLRNNTDAVEQWLKKGCIKLVVEYLFPIILGCHVFFVWKVHQLLNESVIKLSSESVIKLGYGYYLSSWYSLKILTYEIKYFLYKAASVCYQGIRAVLFDLGNKIYKFT